MKRRAKSIIAFFLAVMTTTALFSQSRLVIPVAASSVSSNRKQLNSLQNQISEYDKTLDSMSGEMTGLLEKKSQIDAGIQIISEKMAKTDELISLYDNQIEETNDNISVLKSDIDEKYGMFKDWLRMNQLFGDINPVEMIFSANTFLEFLENIDRVGTIIEYQNDVMDSLRSDVNSLSAETANLDQLRSEQLGVMASLRSDSERLSALREESDNYIINLQKNIDTYEELKNEVKQQEDQLNEEIENQLRGIAKQEEDARIAESVAAESRRVAESERVAAESRRAAESNSSNSKDTEAVTEPETEPTVTPNTPTEANFLWPIADRFLVSTTFGYIREGEVPHRGIDIPAPAGTAIRAVESGTVITAAKHSSYGNYVIVSHGNGYATLYAHCTALYVSVGQSVTRGQTIASVGNTGYSKGNHLHFEIRLNGALTDPLSYYNYMNSQIVIQIYG